MATTSRRVAPLAVTRAPIGLMPSCLARPTNVRTASAPTVGPKRACRSRCPHKFELRSRAPSSTERPPLSRHTVAGAKKGHIYFAPAAVRRCGTLLLRKALKAKLHAGVRMVAPIALVRWDTFTCTSGTHLLCPTVFDDDDVRAAVGLAQWAQRRAGATPVEACTRR